MADETESFIFNPRVSELEAGKFPEPRDLEDELFGKKGGKRQAIIDNIQQEMGLAPKKENHRLKYHNVVLSPAEEEDQTLLDKLCNDKRYAFIQIKDTWTAYGEYKMFIMYSEDLDFKPKEKDANDESNKAD